MRPLWETPGREGRAGDGHHLRPVQDPERGVRPFIVKTKDWASGRRWAKRNAISTPGVTYAIVKDGWQLSYRYEDGLMYCTGHTKRMKPYRPWLGHYRKGNEFIPISKTDRQNT